MTRKYKIFTGLLILALITAVVSWPGRKKAGSHIMAGQERSGTAILITGAAARIPQEAALLEQLYDRGLLNDVVFISGASSVALNSVMLNGILSGRMTWAEYRNILFSIHDSDIFIQEGKKLPVNTEPLRRFVTGVVEERLDYHTIGDLPYATSISVTRTGDIDLKNRVYRMCSRKINPETDTTLSLVDILMASTSFPVAFPSVSIRNVTTIPDVKYIDGGVGDDHIPFQALLDYEESRGTGVDTVYIVSRKSDSIPEVSEELRILGLNDRGLFDKLGVSLDNILYKGFKKRLEAFANEAPDLIPCTYVWIPDFKADFLMFSFSNLEEQFNLTTEWAVTHEPVPLSEYIPSTSYRRK
ncbi:MAG: patatin-like phospholipase family protein [Bacteroidota bacterium]|nr:patatin-like phospholipase family protein [Bacteroidota bacterium]